MGNADKTPYDIFISYRRDGGAETAKHLRDILTERGYRVFFDTDSLRSGNFNLTLLDVIESCTDFIIICSPHAFDRCVDEGDWVRLELAHALEHNKNVVPLLCQGFEFPKELPSDIDDVRWRNGVTVNIEFFDAMIDKLVSFLQSKPAARKKPVWMGVVMLACVALAVVLALVLPRLGQTPSAATDTGTASNSQDAGASAPQGESEPEVTAQKTTVQLALGDAVDVCNASSGQLEYRITVDGVHVMPDSIKYDMWETYDEETTALLGVQCSVENSGYSRGDNGEVQLYKVLQDDTVTAADEEGFLLSYVGQMYHGSDGKYPCQSATSIPSGSKGRFCFLFYVDKDATRVTIRIDSHNGQVHQMTVDLPGEEAA